MKQSGKDEENRLESAYADALALAEKGRVEEARRAYGLVLEEGSCPAALRAAILNDLGCLHFSEGDVEQAHAFVRRALELDPDCEDALANLEAMTDELGRAVTQSLSPRPSIRIEPGRHVLYYSLESKSRSWFAPWGGRHDTPNFDRLTGMSRVFDDMSSPGCSTSLAFSAITGGRFAHEFERADYQGDDWYDDNLFKEMQRQGRRCYVISCETFLRDYWPKIYGGPGVEVVRIPDADYSIMKMTEMVLEIIAKSDEPTFILSHTFPLRGLSASRRPQWRSGMERFIAEDDEALGHLLDGLDLDETTLLVCADHGNSLGENRGIFAHAFFPYETQVTVPCWLTGAGVGRAPGSYCSIQLRDLLLGREIGPLDEIFHDTLYVLQPHRVSAMRFDDWKYVAHYSWATALTGLQEELYDLRQDPNEARNLLADRGRHPLRSDWNAEQIREALGGQYGYDESLLVEQLRRGRAGIAKIWTEGLLRRLDELRPQLAERLRESFAAADDLLKLQIVGRIVNELVPGPQCYEKVGPGEAPPTIPVPLDEQPRGRDFCDANWSQLDASAASRSLASC